VDGELWSKVCIIVYPLILWLVATGLWVIVE
jgi:hypothetical protein